MSEIHSRSDLFRKTFDDSKVFEFWRAHREKAAKFETTLKNIKDEAARIEKIKAYLADEQIYSNQDHWIKIQDYIKAYQKYRNNIAPFYDLVGAKPQDTKYLALICTSLANIEPKYKEDQQCGNNPNAVQYMLAVKKNIHSMHVLCEAPKANFDY